MGGRLSGGEGHEVSTEPARCTRRVPNGRQWNPALAQHERICAQYVSRTPCP